MIDKLYIVGNGFDKHHEVESSYGEFRQYCQREDAELYQKLEKYYDDNDLLWSDFEMQLASLNPDSLMDDARILFPDWDNNF